MIISTARQKLALHWNRRVISRFVQDDPPHPTPLTLMVPLAPKDVDRARRSVPLMQERIAHPIERTVIVAPDRSETRAVAEALGTEFLDEIPPLTDLLGAERLNQTSGWVRQQVLKLIAPDLLGAELVVVMDSDTYPLRPTAFMDTDGRHIFYRGDPNREPFHQFTMTALGHLGHPSSFVAHCMLFKKTWLSEMFAEIEARWNAPAIEALMNLVDRPVEQVGMISEYDLYGHFVRAQHGDQMVQRYYAGIKVPPDQFQGAAPLSAWKQRFRFVSNHERG